MGRVITQTRDRTFSFLLNTQKLGHVLKQMLGRVF